jgi:hypothetical protein
MSTPKSAEFKAELKREVRTRTISFRMTEEEYKAAEDKAAGEGLSVHDWCRKVTEEGVGELRGMSPGMRAIYEEVAKLRYITGRCFRLLAGDDLDVEAWNQVVTTVDKYGAEIADDLQGRATARRGSDSGNEEEADERTSVN